MYHLKSQSVAPTGIALNFKCKMKDIDKILFTRFHLGNCIRIWDAKKVLIVMHYLVIIITKDIMKWLIILVWQKNK